MKTAILTLFTVVALAGIAAGQLALPKVSLTCDPPEAGDVVRGYVLYKKAGTAWEQVTIYPTPDRLFEIPQPILGGSEYALTAYNEVGESEVGESVFMPGRPGKPLNTRVTIEFK